MTGKQKPQGKVSTGKSKPNQKASSVKANSQPTNGSTQLPQHHVSKILDEVLEDESKEGAKFKHPMLLDVLPTVGLLLAMGGFTIGLINLYITHSAEQCMLQRNYKAAIAILSGAPFPRLFNFTASQTDPVELLNQAIYLDAIDRLEANSEDDSALQELERIRPGSRFFEIAQSIVKERMKPSAITLQGQAIHDASPSDLVVQKERPIFPEEQ